MASASMHMRRFASLAGLAVGAVAAAAALHVAARHEPAPQPRMARKAYHWQASQSGLSMAQNLMSLAASGAGTAFNAPERTVDFSACVAPIVRR